MYPVVIVTLTNQDRQKNNLSLLATNVTLAAAAKLKADDMASKGYFAHTSPEGHTPWYWFSKAGYQFIYAGENLAVNYMESDAVQNAWLNSPTHRANIMNSNFTEMGVATASGIYNGQKTTFVVELFGMPATQKLATTTSSTPNIPVTTTPAPEIKGETSIPLLSVLEETNEFTMVKNNDESLEPGIGSSSPTPRVSWIKRLIVESDKIAGLIIEIILVIAIISTAGMVAREYEKHHKKHMAYGVLLAVAMFAFLFVGGIGVFNTGTAPLAQAMELIRSGK